VKTIMNQPFKLSIVDAASQFLLAMMISAGFLESIAKAANGYFAAKLFVDWQIA